MSWTLDGIDGHADAICAWLEAHEPVVVCLRGTRIADGDFPLLAAWELGYYTKLYGAADEAGLAILSIEPPRDVHRGLGEGRGRTALSGRVAGIRIVNLVGPAQDEEIQAYLDARVAPHEKVLAVGVPDGSTLSLRALARDPEAHPGVYASDALAAQCAGVEPVAVPLGISAVAIRLAGMPAPEIPDLDITR